MLNDPTDETRRKPRRLRNTPLLKYVRLTSLVITLMYVGAMYVSYRRNILPYLDDERYKPQISKDEHAMIQDYASNLFMKGIIGKLIERREAKSKVEAESENTPIKEA